jgi:hypothetical protein
MGDKGRKENLGESAPLNLKIPKPLFEHLSELARNTHYGVTVTEVATYFLKQAVDRIIERDVSSEEPTSKDQIGK